MSNIDYLREFLVSLFSKTNNLSVDLWVQRVHESFCRPSFSFVYEIYSLAKTPEEVFHFVFILAQTI